MKEEITSLYLFEQQKKVELIEKLLKIYNDDAFEPDSLSAEELPMIRATIKKLFNEI